MKLFWNVLDWFLLGGFGRFMYRALAYTFAVALVAEIVVNGFTGYAWTMAVLAGGVLVCLFSD